MSEPPPKPAHRPVRGPQPPRRDAADDFDFDVDRNSSQPQPQQERIQSLQQQAPHNEQPESGAAAPYSPPAGSSREGSQPPRPPHRPQRPASRPAKPISIQPAPADPPQVRQKSELRSELEALDSPGAANDDAAVRRFKDVGAALDREGPGGETAASLGYPALGPQKVPHGGPPPKPLTRPVRRKTDSNSSGSPAPEPESMEPETKEPERGEPERGEPERKEPERKESKPKEPEAKEPEPKEPEPEQPEPKEPEPKEPEQKQPEQKESEPKEPEPKEPEHKEPEQKESEHKEPQRKEPETKETEPESKEPEPVERKHSNNEHNEHGHKKQEGTTHEQTQHVHKEHERASSERKESELKESEFKEQERQPNEHAKTSEPEESQTQRGSSTQDPAAYERDVLSKHSATKEVPAPKQDPVLNKEHTLKDPNEPVDQKEPGGFEAESHTASQKLDARDSPEPLDSPKIVGLSRDHAVVLGDSEMKRSDDSAKFVEPVAVDPKGADVVTGDDVHADVALSKEDNGDIDPSDLDQQRHSDPRLNKHAFVEPVASAPDDAPVPSSPKKRVAFTDAVSKISSNADSEKQESNGEKAVEDRGSRDAQGKPKDSLKMTEPDTHQPLPKTSPEEDHLSELLPEAGSEETKSVKNQQSEEENASDSGDSRRSSAAKVPSSKDAADEPLEDKKLDALQKSADEGRSGSAQVSHDVDTDRSATGSKDGLASNSEEAQRPSDSAKTDPEDRRSSDSVDPKDSSSKPPRPQHRPELKPKPVPKPKPKNALASRFEAALRESEASKPKPVPRPKPRDGSAGSRISAIQASMFANLNDALSRGPPQGGRPRFGSQDSQESERSSNDASEASQKVDVNESAEAQLQAMPKNPRARAAGPRRAKRLPESAKPKFSVVTAQAPIWQIPASDEAPARRTSGAKQQEASTEPASQRQPSEQKSKQQETAEELQGKPYGQQAKDHERGIAGPLESQALKPQISNSEETGPESFAKRDAEDADHKKAKPEDTKPEEAKPKDAKPEEAKPKDAKPAKKDSAKTDIDEEQERCAEEGLYAEPTVETRWVPDQISQAVPSQKPRSAEEIADDEHGASDDSANSGQSSGPNLRADTENDLRTALHRHLSHESSEVSSDSRSTSKESSDHAVTVEDLPPLGSLVDRVPSPPAVHVASGQASTLMTPRRKPQEQASPSSLGVSSLSQYLDKSPQTGAAPSGWDRMPASSKLDLGEAEGLLKNVKEMKSEFEAKQKPESDAPKGESDHKPSSESQAPSSESKPQPDREEAKKAAYAEPSE